MKRERGLYKRIGDRILEDFGELLEGEMLPGERTLAEKYSVKRSTIQYALGNLAEKGLVVRIRGKGTYLRKSNKGVLNISDDALKGTAELIRSYGVKIKNVVLVSGTVTGNRFLESKLGLQSGEPVFALHRVRYGNNEPLIIEYTYLPKKYFPGIEGIDFRMVPLSDFMRSRGRRPEKYNKKFRFVKLFPKEARYLELPVDAPAFIFEMTGFDSGGHIVEYTENYVRSDKTEFSITTKL